MYKRQVWVSALSEYPIHAIVKGIASPKRSNQILINNIRAQSAKGLKVDKTVLAAICTSMLLDREKKSLSKILNGEFIHTGLIQADFDIEGIDYTALMKKLAADPYVAVCFRSPSNKVKAFFFVKEVKTLEEHKAAFEAVSAYCLKTFGYEIDQKNINIGRLCFLSSDPNIVLKEAYRLDWKVEPKVKAVANVAPIPRAKSDIKTSYKRTINDRKMTISSSAYVDWSSMKSQSHSFEVLQQCLRASGAIVYGPGSGVYTVYVECPAIGSHTNADRQSDMMIAVTADKPWAWGISEFHESCGEWTIERFAQITGMNLPRKEFASQDRDDVRQKRSKTYELSRMANRNY